MAFDKELISNAGEPIHRSRISGDTGDRYQLTGDGRRKRGQGTLTVLSYLPELCVPFITAATAYATAPNSDQFWNAAPSLQQKVDLSGFTEARFVAQVVTVSASANTPILQCRANITGSRSVTQANFTALGAAASTFQGSLFTGATEIDTGWQSILAANRIDNVWLAILQNGGDGAANPSINGVTLWLR